MNGNGSHGSQDGMQVEVWPVERLIPYARNAKTHDEANVGLIAGMIQEFGWMTPVLVDEEGVILAGHGRRLAALKLGLGRVPVIVKGGLTKAQKQAYRIADNKLTERAPWDAELVRVELEELKEAGYDLGLTAFDVDELKAFWPSLDEAVVDGGAEVDRAEELCQKWGVEPGDLWELGAHRLICGDCTDPAVVNAVAFGNRIDLWASDPPYGVSYAEKNEYLNAVAFGNRIQTPILNDHLTVEEAAELWRKAFGIVFDLAKPGCVYYVHAPQGGDLMMMMMILREVGWLLKPQIIWVKNNHVLGRSDYQLKHEPILYGWKDGGGHFWCGSRSEMSVWEVAKPQNSDFHPTTKPLELIEKEIANSSRPGEVVFDGFLGSGTTLLACERLGRKCMAVELSPGYVAVALERWATATGRTPVKVGGP